MHECGKCGRTFGNKGALKSHRAWKHDEKFDCSEEELYSLYWENLFPCDKIAEKFGVSPGTVRNRLEKCGIPRRRTNTRAIAYSLRNYSPSRLVKGSVSELEKGYFTGLLEGEGCMGVRRHKSPNAKVEQLAPFVEIINTDRDLLETIVEIAGGGISLGHKSTQNAKRTYTWRICGTKTIYDTLSEVRDSLVSSKRKEVANLVIEFCERRINRAYDPSKAQVVNDERDWEIYEELKKLNKQGIK